MEEFVHQQNLLSYRKQLIETSDDSRQRQLLKLLAEEEAKDQEQSPENKAIQQYRPLFTPTPPPALP